jgi:predicted nucleic acid-binding Zn ribbon protein
VTALWDICRRLPPQTCSRGAEAEFADASLRGCQFGFLTWYRRSYYNRRSRYCVVPSHPKRFHAVTYDFTCPACGARGTLDIESLPDSPRCPICGDVLAVAPSAGRLHRAPVDADRILGWLSEPDPAPSGIASTDTTCLSCGYSGVMDRDQERGGQICPACQAAYQRSLGQLTRKFDCPQCGNAFTLVDRDRGKTTVCPACSCFLGCIWPVERPKRRLFG